MSIKLENISYTYGKDPTNSKKALDNINLEIQQGEFIALIGHTGSGKSTLIQLLNGLLKAKEGTMYFNGENIYQKKYKKRDLRKHVGIVFQYPEQQLFEKTVLKDVCFGPKNQGYSIEECKQKAVDSLNIVGLDSSYYERSPLELSGGEKRRVAIAGVLAMEPKLLVLDEPTAGLDPHGCKEILEPILQMNKTKNMSVLLVTHNMEDAVDYANRILVIDQGKILYDGLPEHIFSDVALLENLGLKSTEAVYLAQELHQNQIPFSANPLTIHDMIEELANLYTKGGS